MVFFLIQFRQVHLEFFAKEVFGGGELFGCDTVFHNEAVVKYSFVETMRIVIYVGHVAILNNNMIFLDFISL